MDDETDGHVDNLACFIKPGAVMALISTTPEDENYDVLQDNLLRLNMPKMHVKEVLKLLLSNNLKPDGKKMNAWLSLILIFICRTKES